MTEVPRSRRPPVSDTVRVGIAGYGLMGRMHAYAYGAAPLIRSAPVRFEPVVISGRDRGAVAAAAHRYGIGEWTDHWETLVQRADVDVVDICTPPGAHAAIAIAAARAGKSILCEKPLATTYGDALAALQAVRGAGVQHAVGFNYRHLPAVSLLAEMVAAGEVGEVRLWRGTWLSDEFVDPATPFDWRFDAAMGGTTIADLGCHLVDLAEWIVGPVADVAACSSTFVTERPEGGRRRTVNVDDASSALLRFAGGAQGVLAVARAAPRRPCDFTIEVNGSCGSLFFSYDRLNELWFGDGRDDERRYGMRRIRAEHPSQPETDGWWPIGQGIGYDATFVNQVAALADGWGTGVWSPGFDVGARVVRVCAAMERSAAERRWVAVHDVTASDDP